MKALEGLKAMAAKPIATMASPPEEEAAEGEPDPVLDAADDLMLALKSGDRAKVGAALKAAVAACKSYETEE